MPNQDTELDELITEAINEDSEGNLYVNRHKLKELLIPWADKREQLDRIKVFNTGVRAGKAQSTIEARIDELEKLFEVNKCLRPGCSRRHTNLKPTYVRSRLAELNKSKGER